MQSPILETEGPKNTAGQGDVCMTENGALICSRSTELRVMKIL